jgi:transposase
MDARDLLPNPDYEVEAVRCDEEDGHLQLSLRPTAEFAICPGCQTQSHRVHSWYHRRLRDISWGGRWVEIRLKGRRFFCDKANCPRKIFTERLPGLAAPHAQRTERLVSLMQRLGLLCGGTMAVGILRQLPTITSRWTVLRDVRKAVMAADYTPRVLGVDDWAMRRGHRYGTILVDLEAQQVIDLLPDREADTLVAWLTAHPGIQVISRDRAGAYAQAAQPGAPDAVQVADRWHLLKNLGDALTNLFGRHRRALQQLKEPLEDSPPDPAIIQSSAYQRRQLRFEQVHQLRQDGLTISAIANIVHLDRKTIRKYLNSDRCPGGQRRRSSTRANKLTPYRDYLLTYGLDGQRTVRQLWRDIQDPGYDGGLSAVAAFLAAARHGSPQQTTVDTPPTLPTGEKLTPRRATWLVLSRTEDLTQDQRQQAEHIAQIHPDIALMVAEARAFAAILRQHIVEAFDTWLQRTRHSTLRELRSFARGIQRDYFAVKAALELPFSNGRVEGNVNRLKFIQRSMFGRAKFDLLRLRVLAPT